MPYQPNRSELRAAVEKAASEVSMGGHIANYLQKEYPEFMCEVTVDTLIVVAIVGRVEVKVVL